MNIQKFTQKSMEALEKAEGYRSEYGNPEIVEAHLLRALLADNDGLITGLFRHMNIPVEAFAQELVSTTEKLPRVGGNASSDRAYVSEALDRALKAAEKEAEKMKDDFVSVEHLMLGLIEKSDKTLSELFSRYSIKRDSFLSALKNVRGNQTVKTDNPEATYDVLKKYGQDLVEL
ncbi:MAG: type VI secretion system ATPase TssH, partial [Clostridia bacterium]|nr:type VI secretion system ATPase TssH [Clostridia bacterium]